MPIDHNTLTALRSANDWKLPPGMTINGGVPLGAQGLYAASNVTLSNVNTAQSIFSSAADALTVEAKTTYRVNGLIRLVLDEGSTPDSHTTSIGIGGTATFSTVGIVLSAIASNGTTLADLDSKVLESATAVAATAASTANREMIRIEGVVIVNAAGTLIPQLTFSADPTGTCYTNAGSFFEIYRIGNSTVVGTGLYS